MEQGKVPIPGLSIGFKIWFNLDEGGEDRPFLGEQKIQLLKEIDRTGSIREAATEIGLDYHKAWDMIQSIHEKIDPLELVLTQRGRKGGSSLSSYAQVLIAEYDQLREQISNSVKTNGT